MKKTVLKVLSLALVLVFAAFFAACEKDPPPGNDGDGDDIDTALYGKWKNSSNSLTVEFKEFKTSGNSKRIEWGGAVGSMYSDLPADKWTAKNGSISMTYQGNTTIVWYYTINGSGELVLTSPTIDTKHTLVKAVENWTWTTVADSTFWQYNASGFSRRASINAVAYGNGKWVAGSSNVYFYSCIIAYSPDNGVTWTAVADGTSGSRSWINAVAYGNNRWVAVGEGGKMAYSADGVIWTAVADSTGFSYINAVAHGNNRFVAVGGYGKMAYSADGASWTAVTNSTFGDSGINAVAYGNGRFVAGGSGGKMAYSTDNGVTWTAVANSTFGSSSIGAVAYGNNRFVAVGGSKMAYSSNGENWTAVADSTSWRQYGTYSDGSQRYSTIYAIAYGNGRFVAVGGEGKMAYSANGENWTAVTNSVIWDHTYNEIESVAYGNGRFVAVGGEGKMAYVDW